MRQLIYIPKDEKDETRGKKKTTKKKIERILANALKLSVTQWVRASRDLNRQLNRA